MPSFHLNGIKENCPDSDAGEKQMSLAKKRQTLQQVKSTMLHKAQIAEEECRMGHKVREESVFLYAHAAEIEVQIVKLLQKENKKFHPNLISAISCYIKSEEYLKAGNLLGEYCPKRSKYYSTTIIKELWGKVGDRPERPFI